MMNKKDNVAEKYSQSHTKHNITYYIIYNCKVFNYTDQRAQNTNILLL